MRTTPLPTITSVLALRCQAAATRPSPPFARRSGSILTTPIPTQSGVALNEQGKLDEADRRIPRGDPAQARLPRCLQQLGLPCTDKGKVDEAIAEYRGDAAQARLRRAHYNLGIALTNQGKLDEAIAEFRAAIRLNPDYAEANCNLGGALQKQGDYAGALEMYRKGHELGLRRPDWRYPSAAWVAEAERKLTLSNRFPAVLRGDDKPKTNAERLGFALMAYDRKRFPLPPDSGLRPWRPTPSSATIARTGTVTTPPAQRHLPPPGKARMSRLITRRR